MPKLDEKPARTDLTTRECAKLIGGTIGALCTMADIETVKAAIQWWSENDSAWQPFRMLPKVPQ